MSQGGVEQRLSRMTKAGLLQVLHSLLDDNTVRRKIQKTVTGETGSSSSSSGDEDDDELNEYDEGY